METIIVNLISLSVSEKILLSCCLIGILIFLICLRIEKIKRRKQICKIFKERETEREKVRSELARKKLYYFIQSGKVLDENGNEPSLFKEYSWQCLIDFGESDVPDKAVQVCFSMLSYSCTLDKPEIILKPTEGYVAFRVVSLEKKGQVILEHPIMGRLILWNIGKKAKKEGQMIDISQRTVSIKSSQHFDKSPIPEPVVYVHRSFFRIPRDERHNDE